MTRTLGYLVESGPGILREADTSTCAHCQRVSFLKPPVNSQIVTLPARCGMCRGFLCEECYDRLIVDGCIPYEKQCDIMEKTYLARKSLGI